MKSSAMLAIPLSTIIMLLSSTFVKLPGLPVPDRTMISIPTTLTLETLTVYNPVRGQCDENPFVTASNKMIDTTALVAGRVRWMALSRDLLQRWGGNIHYGDTVWLNAGDKVIDGSWVVQDTMNKRFTRRGDLLFDAGMKSNGKWNSVSITFYDKLKISRQRGLH